MNDIKPFNNVKEIKILMFYHSTFRNVLGLTTLSFVCLTFSKNLKSTLSEFVLKLLAFIFALIALYFNYTLIMSFKSSDKHYEYVSKYLYVNYTIFLILFIVKVFILYQVINLIIKLK